MWLLAIWLAVAPPQPVQPLVANRGCLAAQKDARAAMDYAQKYGQSDPVGTAKRLEAVTHEIYRVCGT